MQGVKQHPCPLYPLDAIAPTTHQVVTTKNISRQCQMFPRGTKNGLRLRTAALKEKVMRDPDHFLPQKKYPLQCSQTGSAFLFNSPFIIPQLFNSPFVQFLTYKQVAKLLFKRHCGTQTIICWSEPVSSFWAHSQPTFPSLPGNLVWYVTKF